MPLKYVVALRGERASDQSGLPYVGLADIEPYTGRLAINREQLGIEVDDESIGNLFRAGDVLFGKLRPYLAKVWIAESSGRCTTELLVMQPVLIEPRYLKYVLLSPAFIDRVSASTFGSKMPRAEWSFIGNMAIHVPDIKAQCAVANRLDRELAALNGVAERAKSKIALLAERRTATIAAAVGDGAERQSK